MTSFLSGRELSRAFYAEVVAPLVRPWRHAAAHWGWGSDVLGWDDERSTDHGWGPRVCLFVAPPDVAAVRDEVEAGLPETFRGRAVRFGWDTSPPRHRVEVNTVENWLADLLGTDPVQPVDWLLIAQQHLLEVVRGAVFADPEGTLAVVQGKLRWYPDDVWLWLLACQWRRLDEDEPFLGRAAEVGDDLGSALLAARQVQELMRLAFLIERRYAPYRKWFGTAFAELPCAAALSGPLRDVSGTRDQAGREAALAEAYETIARRHNEILPAYACDPSVRRFHDRPFRVLAAERFAQACLAGVTDPALARMPLVGGIDQVTDSTELRDAAPLAARLRALYAPVNPA